MGAQKNRLIVGVDLSPHSICFWFKDKFENNIYSCSYLDIKFVKVNLMTHMYACLLLTGGYVRIKPNKQIKLMSAFAL